MISKEQNELNELASQISPANHSGGYNNHIDTLNEYLERKSAFMIRFNEFEPPNSFGYEPFNPSDKDLIDSVLKQFHVKHVVVLCKGNFNCGSYYLYFKSFAGAKRALETAIRISDETDNFRY